MKTPIKGILLHLREKALIGTVLESEDEQGEAQEDEVRERPAQPATA